MAAQLHATASARERADGVLDDAKLATLVQTFRELGYATVGNVIPAEALDALQGRMDYDAAHQAAARKWEERGGRSGAGGHLQMGVPRMAPYVSGAIVANPIIEQLAVALLGQPREIFLAFFNGVPANSNSALASRELGLGTTAVGIKLLTLQATPTSLAVANSFCILTVDGTYVVLRRQRQQPSRGHNRRPVLSSISAPRRSVFRMAQRNFGLGRTWTHSSQTMPSRSGLRAPNHSSEKQ
eukprot:SAG31_NODE_6965_length_1831_cov_1.802654_1_plen_241_part_00